MESAEHQAKTIGTVFKDFDPNDPDAAMKYGIKTKFLRAIGIGPDILQDNYDPATSPQQIQSAINMQEELIKQRAPTVDEKAKEAWSAVVSLPPGKEQDDALIAFSAQFPRAWSAVSILFEPAKRKTIEMAAEKAHATKAAVQTPDIQAGQARQNALTATAHVQQLKVDAANSAMQILHKDEIGKFVQPTPQQATELAMACVCLISPSGVIAQQQVEEIQQKTLKEGLSRALAWIGVPGIKLGGTTQQNLENIERLIVREGKLAESQRDKATSGELTKFSGESGMDLPTTDKSAQLPQVKLPTLTPAEAAKLPSGTHFLATDGTEQVKN